jgi:TonB-dependent starch-binding outer membrane protein SusC
MFKLFTISGAGLKLRTVGVYLTFMFVLFTHSEVMAQSKSKVVTGFVYSSTDPNGMPGVTVLAKNTNNGVITDLDGKFKIELSADQNTLVFNFVGFATQEIVVGDQVEITLELKEDSELLDEVVVVGYGSQKKVNLTGSVQTARFVDAVNIPVTNSAQLMYGKFTGVQLTQSNGLPGGDNSSILIRGIGTFGNSAPLVVIDNIQYTGLREFNNLAASDIESITVLKDASASAIYGARGANGVILVTTKVGKKGKGTFEYNNFIGFQRATVVPKYLDGIQYATLWGERDKNANPNNTNIRYTEADIEAIRTGSSPEKYANTDWASLILRDAPMQNHYLSFSGGSDNTTYRVSGGYLTQDAIVRGKFTNDRYSLSTSLSSKANNWLSFNFNSNSYWTKFEGPAGGPDAITGETGIINQFQRSHPVSPAYLPDGSFAFVDGSYLKQNPSRPINNPLFRGVFGDYESNNINTSNRLAVTINFLKDFSFETSGSVNVNQENISNFTPTRLDLDWEGKTVNRNDLNTLTNDLNLFFRLQSENILRYKKTLGKHNINALVGHSAIYDKSDGFAGSLQGFPSNSLTEFNAGGVVNPAVSGGASEVSIESFFGRVNYNFDDKYLLEANVRRDGSSRFGPNNRYGTFPSFSLGWNVDREGFLKNIEVITSLKLRASWGLSGNDRIDNYIYAQNYNSGLDYTIGNDVVIGAVAQTTIANPNIAWEAIEQLNVGMDLGLFKNKLNVTLDVFNRNSSDILYTNFPIPATIGVTSLGARNAASMTNKGVEADISYRTSFGKLKMTLGGNVTRMADNNVTSLGPNGIETIGGNRIIRIGEPLNALFGHQFIGVFQTVEEVASSPRQFGSTLTKPGDLKYADISGPNKVPDGIVDANDRVVIGNQYPRWMFGFNTSFEFVGFDLNATIQGVNNLDRFLNANGQFPLEGDRNNALSYWINRWTPENPSTTLPRLGGVNNSQFSSFYVEDMSYVRLRNLELGYAMPKSLGDKLGIQKLRIFVSGQNLFTYTKVENFDPERATGGSTDLLTPLYKVFTTGINIKF